MAAEVEVDVAGEIDTSSADELRAQIYAAIDANPGSVVTVDLSKVDFMDSTGLGVLVAALKHARTAEGDIAITGAPSHIGKLFTITGLDKVFRIDGS